MLFPLLVFIFVWSVEAYRLAQPFPQKRAAYQGGWALGLPGATCPSDTPVACDTNAGTVNPTCCPSGQTCFGLIQPHCCPTDADCVNVVQNLPVCANSTWTMYLLSDKTNFFCCKPGQFGVLPTTGYAGICEPDDFVVASSLIASLATQAGGLAGTSTGGSSASPTKTPSGNTASTTSNQSSPTSGSSNYGPSGSSSNHTTWHPTKAAIIGIAVAGLAALLVAGLLLWRCCGSRKRDAAGSVEPYRNQGYPQPTYQETPQQYGAPAQEYKSPGFVGQQTAYTPQAHELAPQEWSGRAEMGPGRY